MEIFTKNAHVLTFHRMRRRDVIAEYEKAMENKSPRTALRELNPTNLSGGATGGNSRDHMLFNSAAAMQFND